MVWVYEDCRLNADEKKVVDFIHGRTKDKTLAEKTVKILNLMKYIKSHKFRNAKHLQNSVFYDRKHHHPFFNEKTATKMFSTLKQKGGVSHTHPVTDQLIRMIIGYIQSVLPETVNNTVNEVYGMVTGPLTSLEEAMPLLRIAFSAAKATAKIGESTAETVATDVAGPVGETAVALPVAFVGAAAAITSILEDDLGGAAAQIAQATPFIGPTLSTVISTIEENFRGGKRFSTYKNKRYKWQKKTRRIRFVRY